MFLCPYISYNHLDSQIHPIPISKSVHKIMGHSRFIVLLVSSLLFLSFVYGSRRVAMMENFEHMHSIAGTKEYYGKMGIKFEIMDYADPEPNTNPKTGYLLSPPPPISAPPPRG